MGEIGNSSIEPRFCAPQSLDFRVQDSILGHYLDLSSWEVKRQEFVGKDSCGFCILGESGSLTSIRHHVTVSSCPLPCFYPCDHKTMHHQINPKREDDGYGGEGRIQI